MNLPTIVVTKDIDADTDEFVKFLYHWSAEKQSAIILAYPEHSVVQ